MGEFAGAVYGGVAGQDLFYQRGARAGHADDKYQRAVRVGDRKFRHMGSVVAAKQLGHGLAQIEVLLKFVTQVGINDCISLSKHL